MPNKYLNLRSGLLALLSCCILPNAQANGLVSTNQSAETVQWQIASTSFQIDKIKLQLTGPNQGGASIPAGCSVEPLFCQTEYPAATTPEFSTTGLAAGSYVWAIEIVPAVIDTGACDSQIVVRNNQGGNQGLEGGTALSPEEVYLECIRNLGQLPGADVELTESGSFAIAASGTLAVPPSTPVTPGQPDNQAPIAQCQDISIENTLPTCEHNADINNASFDPDGTLASVVQTPAGPFGVGATNVSLTVTDNLGASSSCTAVVTVTDNQAPTTQCMAHNITPPEAPITFTAESSDACSTPVSQITSYDCYRFNKNGKRIDTTDSCVVSLSGASITIKETSGVSSFIDWTVNATDSSGNQSDENCSIQVTRPGKGKK